MSSSRSQQIPWSIRALRLGFRTLNRIRPSLAARVTTNFFLRTRSRRRPPEQRPLGAWPLDTSVPGVSNVHVWGKEGPQALLVHGWGSDSNALFSLAQRLKHNGYRAITFDAPGHGAAPGKNRTTMTDFSEAVRALSQELGGFDLVIAHSLGGIAAVSGVVRDQTPGRMVLISTPCDLPVILERWADFFHLPASLRRGMREQLLQRNGVPVEHWDLRERGQNLDCPVLIEQGGKDQLVPPEEAQKVAAALPRAQYRVEEGLGHQRILMDRNVQDVILAFAQPATPEQTTETEQKQTAL